MILECGFRDAKSDSDYQQSECSIHSPRLHSLVLERSVLAEKPSFDLWWSHYGFLLPV